MVSSASCCKSGPFGPRLETSKLCFTNVFYFAFFHLCFHITPNLNFLFPSALYHTPFDMCVVLCFISLWRIKTLWQACRLPIQLPYKTLIPPPKCRLQQEMVKAFILKAFLIFMCSSSTNRTFKIVSYSILVTTWMVKGSLTLLVLSRDCFLILTVIGHMGVIKVGA